MSSPDTVSVDVAVGGDIDAVSKSMLDRQRLIEDVRRLSTTAGWSHNFRSALVIALQWAIIAGACTAALTAQHWWVWVIAICVIGTRQHALGVLVHEAAHYRLFTNKTVNDTVSDLLCGFPIGIRTSVYRAYHFQHHRFVNDRTQDPDCLCVADDADWSWPKTPSESTRLFLRDLWGLNVRGFARIV